MPPKRQQRNNNRNRRRRNDGEEDTGSNECAPYDDPLQTSSSSILEEEEEAYEARRKRENQIKLDEYVASMAYRLVTPEECKPKFKRTCEELSQPKPLIYMDNYEMFRCVYDPSERGQRMGRIASKFKTTPVEEFSEMFKCLKAKQQKKIDLEQRKQKVFYGMMSRLEKYCRTEYLENLVDKFADFVAKLATTMQIPESLADPFSRLHYALFCNICIVLNMEPISLHCIDLTTKEGQEYSLVNLIAHAVLSLIIKALDAASYMNPDEIQPELTDCELSEYIKERLMNAAAKKVLYCCRKKSALEGNKLNPEKLKKKCEMFAAHDPCLNLGASIF